MKERKKRKEKKKEIRERRKKERRKKREEKKKEKEMHSPTSQQPAGYRYVEGDCLPWFLPQCFRPDKAVIRFSVKRPRAAWRTKCLSGHWFRGVSESVAQLEQNWSQGLTPGVRGVFSLQDMLAVHRWKARGELFPSSRLGWSVRIGG